MSLQITSIENGTTPETEIVWLKADAEMNLSGYALVDNTYQEDKKSNIFRHIFEFPNYTVNKGDLIKVISGKGNGTKVKNVLGTVTHPFYWDAGKCVWNNTKDQAVLIQYKRLQSLVVPAKK